MKLKITKYHKLADISQKSRPFIRFWDLAFNFQIEKIDILNSPIMKLNYLKISQKIDFNQKELIKL